MRLAYPDWTEEAKPQEEAIEVDPKHQAEAVKQDFVSKCHHFQLLWLCSAFDKDFIRRIIANHIGRKKYCSWKKYLIIKLHLIDKMKVAEIANKLLILYGSVSRIVKNTTVELHNQIRDCLPDEWQHRYFDLLSRYISAFLNARWTVFTITDLQLRIKHDADLSVKYGFLRNLLKNRFRLSYKKGATRPQRLCL